MNVEEPSQRNNKSALNFSITDAIANTMGYIKMSNCSRQRTRIHNDGAVLIKNNSNNNGLLLESTTTYRHAPKATNPQSFYLCPSSLCLSMLYEWCISVYYSIQLLLILPMGTEEDVLGTNHACCCPCPWMWMYGAQMMMGPLLAFDSNQLRNKVATLKKKSHIFSHSQLHMPMICVGSGVGISTLALIIS